MSIGRYNAQIKTVYELANFIDLKCEGNSSRPDYAKILVRELRKMNYVDTWISAISSQLYDLLLSDGSIFQFYVPDKNFHYSMKFIDAPIVFPTYDSFLEHVLNSTFAEVGDEFRNEYEEHLLTLPSKESVTPVRYDLSPPLYRTGIHPAGHFHLGVGNEIRISCRYAVEPLGFFLFVIRQKYPVLWQKLLQHKDVQKFCGTVKNAEREMSSEFWQEMDELELYLK